MRMRPMRKADLPAVLKLEKICHTTQWRDSYFRRLFRERAGCWVCEKNGVILGYGVVRFSKKWVHIMNICIAFAYRRHGLGRRMMIYLLEVARKRGATRAWLEVHPNNLAAITLYQRLGFITDHRRKGYYRKLPAGQRDALVMIYQIV